MNILTSLADLMRYPAGEIVDLYSRRWEIEMGYREMRSSLLQNEFTIRSKRFDMIKQEL